MIESTQYRPDFVTPPGDTLQETLDALHMSQADLAKRMDRPVKTINEIIKGKAAITPATALQLERVTAVSASFWNAREARYREYLVAEEERSRLERNVDWLSEVPVAAMMKLRWIPPVKSKVDRSRAVLNFFGVASRAVLMKGVQRTNYRQSTAYEVNPWAVAAWLRQGTIEAREVRCERYDEARFRETLEWARSLTASSDPDFAESLRDSCRESGVALVFVPELPKTRTWGATRWLSPSKALIQMSLRYKTDDHFWFTFFHEAAHVLKHRKRGEFIQGAATKPSREEDEANRFAAEFLIPEAQYKRFLSTNWNTKTSICRFASSLRISPGIVVGRLQHDGHVAHSRFNDLKVKLDWRT